jgi:biotin transport system substrate-specific component
VLLAGFALGPTRGAASQALYLALGLSGLPVFAAASVGTAPFTAGYLVGFLPAAVTVGVIHRRLPETLASLALAATAGTAVIFISGIGWLAWMLGGNVPLAMQQGLVPFLPSAVLQGAAAVGIVRAASSARRRLAGGSAGR